MTGEQRTIVYPSQVLGETGSGFQPGRGVFVYQGKILSQRLGLLHTQGNCINVVPLKGRYDPIPGDFVIGFIEEASASSWLVDINAPYPALLHVNEVPWDIEFGNTEKYLNHGDSIFAKVLSVDETKKLNVTLKDRNLYKIKGGTVIDVEPAIVPRIIGKKGSMIGLLKKYTRTRIFVGQNGRIWIDGDLQNVETVVQAIYTIENESVSYGLTNKIEELLKNNTKDVSI